MIEKLKNPANAFSESQSERTKLRGNLPLSELQDEHREILAFCNSLRESTAEAFRHPSQQVLALGEIGSKVKRLTATITDHQSKEEELILPIMMNQFDASAEAIVRDEHTVITNVLRDLNELVESLFKSPADSNELKSVLELTERFENLLRTHFSHEENVVFWFAGFCLNQNTIRDATPL